MKVLLVWCVVLGTLTTSVSAVAAPSHWVGAWQASPTITPPAETLQTPPPSVHGVIRYTMRLTAAGSQVRLRLSAETRSSPFRVARVRVGPAGPDGALHVGDGRAVTFGGAAEAFVPAGAPLVSDPVALAVKAGDDVAVEFTLPDAVVLDPADERFSLVVTDEAGARTIHGARPLVSEVDVQTQAAIPVVVTLGDSITDGTGGVDPMRGWPGALAERSGGRLAVVNAGISGNRLLETHIGPSALARFDRDVGAVPGATNVVVLVGINDIGYGGMPDPGRGTLPVVSARQIIAGYRQLVERAHLRGFRIIGSTLTPFAGTIYPRYYSPAKEGVRQEVNRWIRSAHAFDGVIDFDAALRDPAHPDRLKPLYDSGDHLHPSDTGYRAMGVAVDLSLFK